MVTTEQAGAAQVYALAGLKVFPLWGPQRGTDGTWRCACPRGAACASPAKHPMIPPAHGAGDPRRGVCRGECGRVGHGLYDATDDLHTVGRWWAYRPHANIGLPAQGNRYAVLDVDPCHGGVASLARLRAAARQDAGVDLLETLTQRTGSGGTHLLYTAPPGGIKNGVNVFGADMTGLDLRGIGGYIVAWPSVHVTGRPYEWDDFLREPAPWPDILSEYLRPAPSLPPAQTAGVSRVSSESHGPMRLRGTAGETPRGYAQAALAREVEALLGTGEGGRNHRLNRAAFSLGQLVCQGELSAESVRAELAGAARAIGLGEAESAASIASGLRAAAGKPRPARQPYTRHPT